MENTPLPLLVHFAYHTPKHAKGFCTSHAKTCKMLHWLCWCILHITHQNMQNAPLPLLVHFAHHTQNMQNAPLPLLVHLAHRTPKHAKCSTAFAGAFCRSHTKTCKTLHCLCWCILHIAHQNMQNAPRPLLVHFAHHTPKHAKFSTAFAGGFCTSHTKTCKMVHCLCWCIMHITHQNMQNAPRPLLVHFAHHTPKHAKCSTAFAGAFCTSQTKTCKMLHGLYWCILHITRQNMQNAPLPLLVHFAHHTPKHAKCSTAFAGAFCTSHAKTCKMLNCPCWCILHITPKQTCKMHYCLHTVSTKRLVVHELEFFRTDAKCTDEYIILGGWELKTRRWFSLKLLECVWLAGAVQRQEVDPDIPGGWNWQSIQRSFEFEEVDDEVAADGDQHAIVVGDFSIKAIPYFEVAS